jgi:hypothetical protein
MRLRCIKEELGGKTNQYLHPPAVDREIFDPATIERPNAWLQAELLSTATFEPAGPSVHSGGPFLFQPRLQTLGRSADKPITMRSWRFALLFIGSLSFAEPPKLPSWLQPYAGATPKTETSEHLTESFYTAEATTQQVLAHLGRVLKQNGVPFTTSADGIGTSLRGSAPECDLLIKVREAETGTTVRISCSERSSTPAAGPPSDVQVLRSTSGRRPLPSPSSLGSDHTRRMHAEAEADHRRRVQGMRRYDNPAPSSAIQAPSRGSFYNNDAPPLQWPSWFIPSGSRQAPKPVLTKMYGKQYLEVRYRTTLPMTDLYLFYEDLFKAQGLDVGPARLETGSTIGGKTVQNAYGAVEAHRSEDGTVNGPKTNFKASFHRSYLNEPITVTLQVSVTGSFGR